MLTIPHWEHTIALTVTLHQRRCQMHAQGYQMHETTHSKHLGTTRQFRMQAWNDPCKHLK